MKKILYSVIAIFALIGTVQANEIKPYVGLGLGETKVESESSIETILELNTGLKFNINEKMFITTEAYFNPVNEILDEKFDTDTNEKFLNKYGARLNLGYNIDENFNTLFSLGVGFFQSKYEDITNDETSKTTDTQGLLLGLGFGYHIDENIEAKFNYEYQKVDHNDWDSKFHQFRLGLAYNF